MAAFQLCSDVGEAEPGDAQQYEQVEDQIGGLGKQTRRGFADRRERRLDAFLADLLRDGQGAGGCKARRITLLVAGIDAGIDDLFQVFKKFELAHDVGSSVAFGRAHGDAGVDQITFQRGDRNSG
jgi:hypothetical protein